MVELEVEWSKDSYRNLYLKKVVTTWGYIAGDVYSKIMHTIILDTDEHIIIRRGKEGRCVGKGVVLTSLRMSPL